MIPDWCEAVGDEVRAVGQHDRDRQLDQLVVGVARMTRVATMPTTSPIAALSATVVTNPTTPSSGDTGPVAAARRSGRATTAVPSLNRLSASTSVASRAGAPRRRNVAMTATGSVAETMAPTMNASGRLQPGRRQDDDATTPADTSTPGAARTPTTDEGLPQLRDVEPVRRLEHEPGHEDDEDELGRDLDRGPWTRTAMPRPASTRATE